MHPSLFRGTIKKALFIRSFMNLYSATYLVKYAWTLHDIYGFKIPHSVLLSALWKMSSPILGLSLDPLWGAYLPSLRPPSASRQLKEKCSLHFWVGSTLGTAYSMNSCVSFIRSFILSVICPSRIHLEFFYSFVRSLGFGSFSFIHFWLFVFLCFYMSLLFSVPLIILFLTANARVFSVPS